MKTSYVIIAVVILVLLAGGGYYMSTQNNAQPGTTSSNTTTPSTTTQGTGMTMPSTTANTMEAMEASPGSMQEGGTEFVINGSNFKFEPNTINAKMGEKVTVIFKNVEGFHDFTIDGMPVKTDQIQAGNEATVSFTPDKKGTFEFYCSVGKHRQMGMKGTLVVE